MIASSNSPSLRRGITTIALAAAAAATLAACGGAADAGDSASDPIAVGIDLTYAPYAYFDGDDPAGFEVDAVTLIAEELGTTVDFRDTRFEQLIPGLAAGQFELVASALYITADRAQEVDFIPTFSTGNSIVVREGDEPLATAADLCGRTVGVIRGGDVVNSLNGEASDDCVAAGNEPIDVREFPTDPEATQALMSGNLDAQVTDAGVASTLDENGTVAVEITSAELLYPIQVGMAVKAGDEETRERIEEALDALRASGAWGELLAEYNLAEADEGAVAEIVG